MMMIVPTVVRMMAMMTNQILMSIVTMVIMTLTVTVMLMCEEDETLQSDVLLIPRTIPLEVKQILRSIADSIWTTPDERRFVNGTKWSPSWKKMTHSWNSWCSSSSLTK